MRLMALDRKALEAGLKPGQGLAEARAMCLGLDAVPADPQADRQFLAALADWCSRYTPLVARDGMDGLFLDITGCSHLFGGEEGLIADALSRLSAMGLEVEGAIADTPGLAWAVARFTPAAAPQARIVPTGERAERLAPLPVQALRLDPLVVEGLTKAGLRLAGDLLALPRAPLARRFGPMPLLRLDQATGREDEPISPRLPVAGLSCERRLAEPVTREEDILFLAGELARGLLPMLEQRGLGGRLFELSLFRVDGAVFHVHAGSSRPLRDARRIEALFAGRFAALQEDLDAGYGFETARLSVSHAEPLESRQMDLGRPAETADSLADFIDQASARFGPDCLKMPVLLESHLPERASALVPAREGLAAEAGPPASASPFRPVRPIRLFRYPEPVEAVAEVPDGPPVQFRWRRAVHRVVKAEGPERIGAEWWIDGEEAPTRDYYRIEDEDGRRYWLYRQGLYDREPAQPRWFMHGLFA
ncbi:protein ImuB [Gellertiella hungarica]|uniref:Protein ImuB n=2 Tax=Gellertiella hungarica TaxID=1572859 RepID=A0A7W6NLM0_9HYPH|nr:protein ImuB [Gellertiella hungarica]